MAGPYGGGSEPGQCPGHWRWGMGEQCAQVVCVLPRRRARASSKPRTQGGGRSILPHSAEGATRWAVAGLQPPGVRRETTLCKPVCGPSKLTAGENRGFGEGPAQGGAGASSGTGTRESGSSVLSGKGGELGAFPPLIAPPGTSSPAGSQRGSALSWALGSPEAGPAHLHVSCRSRRERGQAVVGAGSPQAARRQGPPLPLCPASHAPGPAGAGRPRDGPRGGLRTAWRPAGCGRGRPWPAAS